MSGDNILVAIKSRPLISRETYQNLKPQWVVQDETIFQIDERGHRQSEPYSFDHIFTEHMTNATVYNAVVEPLVKSFLNGFNSTIFAYGQTSSGKTHTMMGTDRIPGIIQMAISDVFEHVSCNVHRRYLISCSYFEIYNEKINDLLDKNGQDLKIREDYCGNTFIYSKEEVVAEAKQVYDLMKVGSKIRKIGCTNMNERSSRSHTIFRLTIKSTENSIENGSVQISHLNLVDLAGSERIAHTKAAGVRLKEGVNINKSLLALGNVIRQLSEGEGYINYRDSNLTRLLQHALGGNAKSLIIATITTAAGEETKSTLEFAQRAKVVKNKPVINEILSEQDKLKQYQLVTASYKDRLEKEKQRIQDMEHEKEEREREILRLKQQVKLIDLFTNGPEEKKIENRIPRRHTMGHYSSRIPLETIPESKIMTTNIIQEDIDNDPKCDLIDEDLLLTAKMLMDESLDEGILPVTPEPPEELLDPVETTPVSHLRVRLKHLEESYTSLQEFTQLESQYKEDKDLIHDLVKEKGNLLKDIFDLNSIVKDTRQEKERMQMRFGEELNTLKMDLDGIKKQNDKLSFALEQAEVEKEALKLAKEQLLNDNEVLLEQQRLKYENRLEYFTKEIETLNKQGKDNEDIKLNTNKIAVETEEKLQKSEKEEEENFDILSVSTQTEEAIQTEAIADKIIKYKEYEELKEEMEKINESCKDKITSYKEQIQLKDDNICELTNKISKLETNLKSYIEEINTYKDEVDLKKSELTVQADKILQIENDINKYQDELEFSAKKIRDQENLINDFNNKLTPLEQQIEKLVSENDSYKEEIQILKKEVPLKDDEIMDLKSKLDAIQIEQSENVSDLVMCKDEIELKNKEIAALLNKLGKFDKDNKNYKQEIDAFKEEIVSKDNTIITLKEKVVVLEKDTHDKEDLIQKMKQLQEEIKIYKDDNAIIKEEINVKDRVISELNHEVTNLEKINGKDKEEIQFREEKILKLSDEIKNLENDIFKLTNRIKEEKFNNEEIKKRNKQILECIQVKNIEISELTDNVKDLENKIKKLEISNCEYIETSDNKILELKNKINNLEHNKEEIRIKNDEIVELKNEINNLKRTNNENDNEILKLNNKIKACSETKEYIETRENKILALTEKIEDLEKCNSANKAEILELTNQTRDLEKFKRNNKESVQRRDFQILELTDKLKDSKTSNEQNKEYLRIKDRKIAELTNTLKDLEKYNTEEIETRDDKILEMTSKISRYKNEIESKERIILELNDKISTLDNIITKAKSGATTEKARSTGRLSTSSSSLDLSPKELRKIKRQSIHDQRRGIDLAEVAAACSESDEDKDLKETIKKLQDKIEELTNENASLEWEVQGFMRELDDCKKYRKEGDLEIDRLNEQIEKVKKGQAIDCKECPQKQHYIKKLEGLQRENKFKIVELQTKIYDLQNARKEDKTNTEEREMQLRYHIDKLEARLADKPAPKLKDTEIQCELTDIDQLLEKYSLVKKLARMRREEANILRARLGMQPDEPVT